MNATEILESNYLPEIFKLNFQQGTDFLWNYFPGINVLWTHLLARFVHTIDHFIYLGDIYFL